MAYNLFLDDERIPSRVTWVTLPDVEWVIVRTQAEFEAFVLENGLAAHFSFDNDLGTGMGEGRYCVKWLVDRFLDGDIEFRPFTFTVHSKNTVAAEWITQYLNQYLEWRLTELSR